MPANSDRQSKVWAITTFYTFDDPPGVARRLTAFREFRRRLPIPLVAVELSRTGKFDLGPNDAETLVQLEGGSLLWQKERLLNIALDSLPEHCETVVWIDCDVILTRADWAAETERLLDKAALVQPFRRLYYMGAGDLPETFRATPGVRAFESAAARWLRGALPDDVFLTSGMALRTGYNPGMAWAARRSLLAENRFYDALIVGAGDKAIFSTACGRAEHVPSVYGMSRSQKEHFLSWARGFESAVGGRLDFVEGDAYHVWHGDLENRAYASRYDDFSRFEFCPRRDIRMEPNGVWSWSSDKPELHDAVRLWFEGRKGVTPPARPAA